MAYLEDEKKRKGFYIIGFRRAVIFLMVSLLLNCVLVVGLYYIYISTPQRDFYSSDGIGAPVELTALLQPNYSSQALLAPDPTSQVSTKSIPY